MSTGTSRRKRAEVRLSSNAGATHLTRVGISASFRALACELNQPLTAILSNAQAASASGAGTAGSRRAARRLGDIVDADKGRRRDPPYADLLKKGEGQLVLST